MKNNDQILESTSKKQSFKVAILIVSSILFIGFLLEWITNGKGIGIPQWPMNLYWGIGFAIVITSQYFLFKNETWSKFLRSTQNSISVIGAYLVMVLLMGSFTQIDAIATPFVKRLGLSHITTSWPFFLLNLYFLLVLGLVTLNRLFPLSWKNAAFFLNHFGLWLTLYAGAIGSSDLQRLQMSVSTFDKTPTWYASDGKQNIELPLAVKLLDFTIEEYSPQLTLINNHTAKLVTGKGKNMIPTTKDTDEKLLHWQIKVLDYYSESSEIGGKFYKVNELGSAPAAKVVVSRENITDTAWISCGSFNRIPYSYKLDETYSLIMTVPEPKKYQSDIVVFTPEGAKDTMLIEVNKAQTVNGYKLYQLSYDEKFGKWSETSILEVVRDPWQPVVYVGIFMMLAGGLYLFFQGSQIRSKQIDN